MARQRTSPIEDLVIVASKLPWWACLLFAFLSYIILHAVAARPVMPTVTGPGQLGNAVTHGLITTAAMFGQYIMVFVFAMAALISLITSLQKKKLYNSVAGSNNVAAMNEMSWEEFEMLVGEHFRRQGFHVTSQGGKGPDGGVDLVLRNKGETYLIQCKQWKAYKVGVLPVRELYGVMASRGAAGGYVVTSGKYTDEARKFANGLNIELIDGVQLRQLIANARKPATAGVHQLPPQPVIAPNCPKCGAAMKKRVARQGDNAGKEFWGCISYPKCNGSKPIDTISEIKPTQTLQSASCADSKSEMKNCPQCGSDMVLRQFQSGPKCGQQFYGCVPCKKGWPIEQVGAGFLSA
jgi:restriction system protein